MKEEDSIDFSGYLNILRKRMILILFITVCSTLAAGLVSHYVLKPIYMASCTVIVGKDSADKITQGEVAMYQNLMETYTEIGKSRVVAVNAAQRLDQPTLANELMSNVRITPGKGTQIINIIYRGMSAEIVAERTNALSQAFVEESQKLLPSGSVKIMDRALVPGGPIDPNIRLNIIKGCMLGLLGSLMLVFLIEYFNNTIKNEDDVLRYLKLPMVGTIPRQNRMVNLIVEKELESPVTEAFKSMRTNLLFSMENRDIKTLMVCSSGTKDGKTSVSTNIASVIAQTGKSVLLIDCDLRKPSVHRHVNISNNKTGLADIILKGRQAEEIIVKINENFDVLTAGIAEYNPSEILSSQKMKDLISAMEKRYDYVILDTPPIIAFTDALTLATNKIGVVLVISSEKSKIEICKKSKQLLLNINANIIGIVLNKVDRSSFVGYGYDYYSYGKVKGSKSMNNSKRKKQRNKDNRDTVNI